MRLSHLHISVIFLFSKVNMYFLDIRTIVLDRKEDREGSWYNRRKLSCFSAVQLQRLWIDIGTKLDPLPLASITSSITVISSLSQLLPHFAFWPKVLISTVEHNMLFLLCSFLLWYVSSCSCLFGMPAKGYSVYPPSLLGSSVLSSTIPPAEVWYWWDLNLGPPRVCSARHTMPQCLPPTQLLYPLLRP